MPRSLHKSWQDKRPGWTRRVRWYQGGEQDGIRLKFVDDNGMANRFYDTPEAAQEAYDEFVEGKLTVLMLLAIRAAEEPAA